MKIKKYLPMLCFFLLLGCLSTGSSGESSPTNLTQDTTNTDDDTTSVKQEEFLEFSVTSESYSSWSDTGYSVILLFPDKPKNEQYDSLAVSIFLVENLVEEIVLKKSVSQKIYLQDSKEYKFSYFAYEKNSNRTSDTLFLSFIVPNSQPIVNINTNFLQNEMKINTEYFFDLSGSYDRDGFITKIFVDWGDGTSQTYDSASKIFSHTYSKPIEGKNIILVVYDNSNQENNQMQAYLPITVAGLQEISSQFDITAIISGETYTNDAISGQTLYAGDIINLDATSSLPSEEAVINEYKWDVYWQNEWHTIATKSSGKAFSYPLNWIGNGIVRLTITDSKGKTSSLEKNILVTNRPPVANLMVNKISGYAPLTVTFTWGNYDLDGEIKKLGSDDEYLDECYPMLSANGVTFDSYYGRENRIYTFEGVGKHRFYLKVEDDFGGVAYDTVEVEVWDSEAQFEVSEADESSL